MSTPSEPQQPPAPTGEPASPPPAPEPPAPTGGALAGTETPPQPTTDPQGLPTALPDGVQVSGRGGGQPPSTPQTPAAPADPPSPPEPQGTTQQPERQEVTDLPDWAQKIIKESRDDAAKARVNAKQSAADEARKALAQDIGKVLGLVDDDTPAEDQLTPEQLKDLLQGERTSTKMARTELAVYKAAQGGNFNASALLDSRSFLDSLKDVDPTDSEALAAKIAEAVQANPWLQGGTPQPQTEPTQQPTQGQPQQQAPTPPAPQPVVPPSGGSFAGGPGGQPQDLSTMSIDDFRRMRRGAPR